MGHDVQQSVQFSEEGAPSMGEGQETFQFGVIIADDQNTKIQPEADENMGGDGATKGATELVQKGWNRLSLGGIR